MHCLCAACDSLACCCDSCGAAVCAAECGANNAHSQGQHTQCACGVLVAAMREYTEQVADQSVASVLKTLESQAWCYYCEGRRHRRVTAHVVKSRPPASSTATTAPALRLTARCQQIRALIDPFYYPGLLTAKCPAAAIGAPSVILGKPVRLAEKNCAP